MRTRVDLQRAKGPCQSAIVGWENGQQLRRFNLDASGYLSQECPSCKRRFKVRFTPHSDDDESKKLAHCPYCDHDGEGCWWTPEQAKYIEAIATREVSDMLNKSMRGVKGWKAGKSPTVPASPIESNDDLPDTTTFSCCSETIRHDGRTAKLRCIVCGTQQQ